MTIRSYDKYYQTENLFGEPYPALIDFFEVHTKRGKVLDMGCGQGRNAIALARMGFSLTGVDLSEVGIEQMIRVSRSEKLNIKGHIADIHTIENFDGFDVILLDSMFHFTQKHKEKEVGLIKKIISNVTKGCFVVICIQDTGNKVAILSRVIDSDQRIIRVVDKKFKYVFNDQSSGHCSESNYRLITIKKQSC